MKSIEKYAHHGVTVWINSQPMIADFTRHKLSIADRVILRYGSEVLTLTEQRPSTISKRISKDFKSFKKWFNKTYQNGMDVRHWPRTPVVCTDNDDDYEHEYNDD